MAGYISSVIDARNLEPARVAQFQALADPVRLQIVAVLQHGPRCVCEVQSAVGPIAANLLSYHLSILRNAGLVSAQRRGRWMDYQLEYAAFEDLRASLPALASTAQDDPDTAGMPGAGDAAGTQVEHPQRCVRRGEGEAGARLRPGRCG